MIECPFCLYKDVSFFDVYPNLEINSYLNNLPEHRLYQLLNRDCKRCPECSSIFYWPLLSDSDKSQLYMHDRKTHHNVGWSRFSKSLDSSPSPSNEYHIISKVLEVLNTSQPLDIYTELNCPFQGIISFHAMKNNINALMPYKRYLITLPSTQMWTKNCFSNPHNSFCRDQALVSGLFHDKYFLYSQKLLDKLNSSHSLSSALYLSNCFDHLDNPLIHLKYILSIFKLVLIRLHPYRSDLGPSMQHIMSIGNRTDVWKRLIGDSSSVIDISSQFSSYTNDRFIMINAL